ncbi:MAG TPA: hypothetical protein VGR62_11490 [Candidatus Binatia bacterium]|jgi:hypothetical protein|nr:hypothetical protein [Candidatus Binatia bacterium]
MSSEDEFEAEQRQIVEVLLDRPLTAREFEGLRIVYPRFVDRFGGTRLGELEAIFRTDTSAGKEALAASLELIIDAVGSYADFEARYPVSVNPSVPAFPLFPIVHLERFQPTVYRVLDGRAPAVLAGIKSAGRLPCIPPPAEPVLRTKPRAHWCAYEVWPTPDDTRRALQIYPAWGDCAVRATLRSDQLAGLAYVAYSVEPNDPTTDGQVFHGYFYETLTKDHDDVLLKLDGGAVQICVYGEPEVLCLEEWNAAADQWETTWRRP